MLKLKDLNINELLILKFGHGSTFCAAICQHRYIQLILNFVVSSQAHWPVVDIPRFNGESSSCLCLNCSEECSCAQSVPPWPVLHLLWLPAAAEIESKLSCGFWATRNDRISRGTFREPFYIKLQRWFKKGPNMPGRNLEGYISRYIFPNCSKWSKTTFWWSGRSLGM